MTIQEFAEFSRAFRGKMIVVVDCKAGSVLVNILNISLENELDKEASFR